MTDASAPQTFLSALQNRVDLRWSEDVQEEARKIAVRREAERLVDADEPEVMLPPDRQSRLRTGAAVVQQTGIPWLIDGVLHQEGLGQLAAPENTGKSVICVDLALSIANGLPTWAGYAIERAGPVLYVGMEGGPVLQAYIAAWLAEHPGCSLDNFFLLDQEELDFTDPMLVAVLDDDIEKSGVGSPALVVFDTQIDVTGAADEMTPAMGQLLAKIRQWCVGHGTFGLLLHHPPYGEKRGRGSTSVRGKCDVLAFADRDKLVIEWQKVKGAARQPPLPFRIESVAGQTGPVATYPRRLVTGMAELASGAGAAMVDKDEATREAIIDIVGRPPARGIGWSASQVENALKGARTTHGLDVHVHKRHWVPVLDALVGEGRVVDAADSFTSGKAHAWCLADTS